MLRNLTKQVDTYIIFFPAFTAKEERRCVYLKSYILTQLEFLLRLLVAGFCGFLIGYERKNRLKEAGVRTHMIVAIGSALIMIVSKYGFYDILPQNGSTLDPSRIAAQVVSGIGFLGAGMIFIRGQAINGLTTAAGVWATAGVGLAIGAKLYVIGIAATVIILIIQIVLHKDIKWLHMPEAEQITIRMEQNSNALSNVQDYLKKNNIDIINFKAEKIGDNILETEFYVKLPQNYDISKLINLLNKNPSIKSIEC